MITKKRVRTAVVTFILAAAVFVADLWFVTGFFHTPRSVAGSWVLDGEVNFYIDYFHHSRAADSGRVHDDSPDRIRADAESMRLLHEIHFLSDGTGRVIFSDESREEFEWGHRSGRIPGETAVHRRGRIWIGNSGISSGTSL